MDTSLPTVKCLDQMISWHYFRSYSETMSRFNSRTPLVVRERSWRLLEPRGDAPADLVAAGVHRFACIRGTAKKRRDNGAMLSKRRVSETLARRRLSATHGGLSGFPLLCLHSGRGLGGFPLCFHFVSIPHPPQPRWLAHKMVPKEPSGRYENRIGSASRLSSLARASSPPTAAV